MLHKIFRTKERKAGSLEKHCTTEERSAALKIIHAGGRIDYYYMAVPASRVLEMYPSHVLARPEVFRRPWESLIQPEEILIPGQRFFVVPIQTVKKLKRRICRKPVKESCTDGISSTNSYIPKRDGSKSKCLNKVEKRCVSFIGVDKKSAGGNDMERKRTKRTGGLKKNSSSSEAKTRRVKMITWEPSLTVIAECHDSVE